MQHLFTFFFRLFLALVAAKFFCRLAGLEGLLSLVGFTLLFLGNVYLFDYLDYRSRSSWRRRVGRRPENPPPAPPSSPEPPVET